MGVSSHAPQDQRFSGLPAFPANVSALMTDSRGDVLIVKPNYRPYWGLPGGVLEAAEAPHECCARGVAAVLGLTIAPGRLLVVDWVPPAATSKGWFGFIFDGGVLTDTSMIRIEHDQLDSFAFVHPERLLARLDDHTATRVAVALRARSGAHFEYLCAGEPVRPQSGEIR